MAGTALIGLAGAGLAWYLMEQYRQHQLPPLHPVRQVDLQRFQGTWNLIACTAGPGRQADEQDVQIEYRLDGGHVHVTRRGTPSHGQAQTVRTATAQPRPDSGNARLVVLGSWPLHTEYWVLELHGQYAWALIGTPDRRRAWILSRTPSLPAPVLDYLMEQLQWLGYAPQEMVQIAHTAAA